MSKNSYDMEDKSRNYGRRRAPARQEIRARISPETAARTGLGTTARINERTGDSYRGC